MPFCRKISDGIWFDHYLYSQTKNLNSMILVKAKHKPIERNFNNFMDDFFGGLAYVNKEGSGLRSVPVNVKETENGYVLEVIAPGFNKEDFKVNVADNLLTIAAERKEETE